MYVCLAPHRLLGSLGIAAVLVGIGAYIAFRPPGSAYLFSGDWMGSAPVPVYLPPLAGCFPDFIHPLALALLSVAVAGCGTRVSFWICVLWAAIYGLFELGQHTYWAAEWVPLAQEVLGEG